MAHKKIRKVLNKLFTGKPVVYTATSPKIKRVNEQSSRMQNTLRDNRNANKHSDGRGVGY